MFQFPGFPAMRLCVQRTRHRLSSVQVSPFGDLRIKGLARLPAAYRSATRPSSASDAQGIPRMLLVA